MTQTAFAAAFARAGGPSANEAAFTVAIAAFRNNGGSFERAVALLQAAYGMGNEGQCRRAQSQRAVADVSRHHDDGIGHSVGADEARYKHPISSSPNPIATGQAQRSAKDSEAVPVGDGTKLNGAGQSNRAVKAVMHLPRPVQPPVPPSAYREAAKLAAASVLDSYKLRNGRAIGDLTLGELEPLRAANNREAAVIRQVQKLAGNATMNQLVRDVIRVADLERAIQRAAEVADAM